MNDRKTHFERIRAASAAARVHVADAKASSSVPEPRPFKRAGTPKIHRVEDAYEEGADVTSTVMCHLHAVTGVPRSGRPEDLVHLTPAAQVDVFDAALQIVRDRDFIGDAHDLAYKVAAQVVPSLPTPLTGQVLPPHHSMRCVWRGILRLAEIAVACAEEEKVAPATKTVRLLDVVSEDDVRQHPLRSLVALFLRVFDRERIDRRLKHDLGDEVYGHLLSVYSCAVQESPEDECRATMQAFADVVAVPDPFFARLDEGQVQLAQVVAAHVADPHRRLDPTLTYAPCGLSYEAHASVDHPTPVSRDDLEQEERRLRKWEADLDGAERRKHESDKLVLARIDGEISQLDRPGWPRTRRQRATLERLRGERVELLAPPPERPEYPSAPPEHPPPRNVRYLSEDERQFLLLAARPDGFTHVLTSGVPDRMLEGALVTIRRDDRHERSRTRITDAGRTAIETWRYEVPAG